MTLDPETRQQLIEAHENIKAQLDDLEVRWTGARSGHWQLRGPQDDGDIYDQLKQELRQIDDMLGADPDQDDHEPGDEDPEAVAAAASAEPDEPVTVDTNANILASRVVVDDATSWSLGRVVLIAAALGIAIAFAVALAK